MCQLTNVLLFTELLPKKDLQNLDQKVNQQQNTVCLKRTNSRQSREFYTAVGDVGDI